MLYFCASLAAKNTAITRFYATWYRLCAQGWLGLNRFVLLVPLVEQLGHLLRIATI